MAPYNVPTLSGEVKRNGRSTRSGRTTIHDAGRIATDPDDYPVS